jgi:hypothetical protein
MTTEVRGVEPGMFRLGCSPALLMHPACPTSNADGLEATRGQDVLRIEGGFQAAVEDLIGMGLGI